MSATIISSNNILFRLARKTANGVQQLNALQVCLVFFIYPVSVFNLGLILRFADCGDPPGITQGNLKVLDEKHLTTEDGNKLTLVQRLKYSCGTGYKNAFNDPDVLNCNGSSGKFVPEVPRCLQR